MLRRKNIQRELIRLPAGEWSLREGSKEMARFKIGDTVIMSTYNHPGVIRHTSIEAVKFMEDDVIFLEDLFEKTIPLNMIETIKVM